MGNNYSNYNCHDDNHDNYCLGENLGANVGQ